VQSKFFERAYDRVFLNSKGLDLAPRRGTLQYREGPLERVICSTRITVTLSVFNFSTRFFAQIVDNRETQLSSLFLGPGDNFSKSYDENQI
jgi:hypothetical protein